VNDQRLFLAFFGFHSESAVARAVLAEQLAGGDQPLEAELLIRDLAEAHAASAAATAARIAAQFEAQGKQDLAVHFYRLLLDGWPEIELEGGQTGEALWAERVRDGALREAWQPPPSYPLGKVEVTSGTGRPDNLYRRVLPIPVRSIAGPGSERLTVSYDGSGASAILVHNGRGDLLPRAATRRRSAGVTSWRIPCRMSLCGGMIGESGIAAIHCRATIRATTLSRTRRASRSALWGR
jgi:hypothetical protein